jgi:hypothetical protein
METTMRRVENRKNLGAFIRLTGKSKSGTVAGSLHDAAEVAKASKQIDLADRLTRAATQVATTTQPGWAAELDYFGTALKETALGQTVLGRLEELSFVAPPNTRIIEISPQSFSVAWVAEGGIKPATAGSLSENKLLYSKVGTIFVLTDDLIRVSLAGGDEALSRVAVAAAASLFDTKLLSADATTDGAPAGLRNGVTETAFDTSPVETLAAALDKLPPSPFAPVVVARPSDLLRLSSSIGTNVSSAVFIASASAPAGKVVAIDPASLVFAPSVVGLTRSTQATIQLNDAPTAGGGVVSLWQSNLAGFLVEGRAAWLKTNPQGVQVAQLAAA